MWNSRGFTLLEVLLVATVAAVLAAVSMPMALTALRAYRLNGAARELSNEISAMRLQAVTKNREMRMRLNCPDAGMYRAVEWTGTGAIDTAGNRCLPTAYPFPDTDAATAPNADGALRYLPQGITFGALQEIQISTLGRVTAVTGALPAQIEVSDGTTIRRLRISAAGQVQIQ
jgi:prepilin-type N-terminal cleavage/methylation domain-containing protein